MGIVSVGFWNNFLKILLTDCVFFIKTHQCLIGVFFFYFAISHVLFLSRFASFNCNFTIISCILNSMYAFRLLSLTFFSILSGYPFQYILGMLIGRL